MAAEDYCWTLAVSLSAAALVTGSQPLVAIGDCWLCAGRLRVAASQLLVVDGDCKRRLPPGRWWSLAALVFCYQPLVAAGCCWRALVACCQLLVANGKH